MTEKPRWTPGPWEASVDKDGTTEGRHTPIIIDDHGRYIASTDECVYGPDACEANAQLIALSPEMAEMLVSTRYESAHYHHKRDGVRWCRECHGFEEHFLEDSAFGCEDWCKLGALIERLPK